MTHSARLSLRSSASLCAWLVAYSCVSPVFGQIDAGIAPKIDNRVPRPQAPGAVLLGNPADPTKVAEAVGGAPKNPGINQLNAGANAPTTPQLKGAIPPGFKLDPKLEKLLSDWETKSQGVQRLNGKFWLYTYDEVFQTETRAEGEFWYQTPDKGRMDFHPVNLTPIKSRNAAGEPINPLKAGPNKVPYVIKVKPNEQWVCNGSEILQIFPDKDKREYNRIVIPKQYQGESIKESPLPFLFGLRKSEATERYLMKLGSMNETLMGAAKIPVYHVEALPLREQDSREWSRAEVLLDARTFLPVSIRTFDPAGTSENVYSFSDVKVNQTWLLDNPFTISLIGLKLVIDKSAPPQQSPGQ